MTKYTAFVALVVSLLGAAQSFGADTPKYHRGDLIHSNSAFSRVGGDKVIFGYKVAEACDVDTLKATALTLKTRSTTDRWDDLWYAFSVPRGRCLVMGWYNLSARKYGWAAIQNQPKSWSVRSNNQGWTVLPNGVQKKFSYTINGQGVDLDIFNPNNTGKLDGDDILISFGY